MQTPYAVVDEAVLHANVTRMAAHARTLGLALRPHAKTHKTREIARLQLDAGAIGLTVATIGEAEVFADAGDLFVAYPLWVDAARAARLRAVAEQTVITLGIDSAEGAANLARHLPGATVLVEVDSGHHRTGVAPTMAGDVAAAAADAGLTVRGVFTFPGHAYAAGGRRQAAEDEAGALAAAADSLRGAGFADLVVSGGATPSAEYAGDTLTELRPGVYVFGDAQQWELGACAPDQIAYTVHATVVSHAHGRLVLDSGSKVLGADRAAYASGFGRLLDHPDARVVQLSEHHAVVEGAPRLPLGSIVRVVPNHVCNAVNLVDELVVGERRWAVAARGRNA